MVSEICFSAVAQSGAYSSAGAAARRSVRTPVSRQALMWHLVHLRAWGRGAGDGVWGSVLVCLRVSRVGVLVDQREGDAVCPSAPLLSSTLFLVSFVFGAAAAVFGGHSTVGSRWLRREILLLQPEHWKYRFWASN